MEMDFQFLEVHEPVESGANASCVEGSIGGSAADCLVDAIADADAQ